MTSVFSEKSEVRPSTEGGEVGALSSHGWKFEESGENVE